MPYILCEMDDHSVTSWSDDEDIILNLTLKTERENFVAANHAPAFPSIPAEYRRTNLDLFPLDGISRSKVGVQRSKELVNTKELAGKPSGKLHYVMIPKCGLSTEGGSVSA